MSDEIPLDSTSFNKNYQVLKQTADWLSTQKEPDIDQLVPKVEKAMQAYSICKDRLTKVQETLGKYFEKEEAGGEARPAGGDGLVKRVAQARPSPDGQDGESIPF
jgi:exodeoxyribonuclease VII small subunit